MENVYQLNDEVKVEIKGGYTVIGKVVDFNQSQETIYVECNTTKDWVTIHPEIDRVTIVEPVQEVKSPEGLKDLKELKEAIADELKGQWYEDIESVKVAVYNTEEDGQEVYDCEVQIVLDNGESVYPTFGTFYNEKDALKHARTMRTKLKRTYDISEQVFVYTC